jgi:hypothetical protein
MAVLAAAVGVSGIRGLQQQITQRAQRSAELSAALVTSLTVNRNLVLDPHGSPSFEPAARADMDADVGELQRRDEVSGLEVWAADGRLLYADLGHPVVERTMPAAELARALKGASFTLESDDEGRDHATGRRPPRWIVVLALVLVALAGAVAVVVSVVNRSGTGSAVSSPGAAGPSVTPASQNPSASGSNSPSAGAPTGGTSSGTGSAGTASSGTTTGGANPGGTSPGGPGPRPVLPSGWVDYPERTGFSVYVPKGWTKSQDGSIVYFRAAGRVLGIDQTAHPNMNPVADWRGKADYRVARGDFPGYHEIHIQSVDYFEKATDWEFTFAGSTTRQHVNNRGLVVNSRQAYGIYWQTPDSRWQDAYPDLQLIFSSFRPKAERVGGS